MLSLDNARWAELEHAYGAANDIPALLTAMYGLPPNDHLEAEPYFSLWSALCHQGDIYSASFAAVPHIVAAIAANSEKAPWTLYQLVACIEIARVNGHGPEIPGDLRDDFLSSLDSIPALVGRSANATWDYWYCSAALAAVAVAKGFVPMAEAILELDPDTISQLLRHKFGER
jgi:hypothetical protein